MEIKLIIIIIGHFICGYLNMLFCKKDYARINSKPPLSILGLCFICGYGIFIIECFVFFGQKYSEPIKDFIVTKLLP